MRIDSKSSITLDPSIFFICMQSCQYCALKPAVTPSLVRTLLSADGHTASNLATGRGEQSWS